MEELEQAESGKLEERKSCCQTELNGYSALSDYSQLFRTKCKIDQLGVTTLHININLKFYCQRESLTQSFLDFTREIFFSSLTRISALPYSNLDSTQ